MRIKPGEPAAAYRWMTEEDATSVGALARRIWNAHYPGIVTQEQIDFMLGDRYAPASLREQIAAGERFLLAMDRHTDSEEEISGFLSLGPLANITHPILRGSDPVKKNDWFLHKFYIAPERQGQGIGKAMLQTLTAEMPEMERLRLQVNRRNENSWQFYLKQGFVIVAEEDFKIGGGFLMEDYVMEKQF